MAVASTSKLGEHKSIIREGDDMLRWFACVALALAFYPVEAGAVSCTRPGVPAGCVGSPAAGAGAGARGAGVTRGAGAGYHGAGAGTRGAGYRGAGAGARGAGTAPANRGGAANPAGVR